jgi:hypothetical protein
LGPLSLLWKLAMLMVQKYHSLKEIDAEFHSAIAEMIKLEFPSYSAWVTHEESHSQDYQFHYYLFFGHEKNTPIGLAQAQLMILDPCDYLPWHLRLKHQFFQGSQQWKMVKWCIGQGFYGPLIIVPKHYRGAREELQKAIHEMEQRNEVVAQTFVSGIELMKFKTEWTQLFMQDSKKFFYVDLFKPRSESYEAYLKQLPGENQKIIQQRWKKLHKELRISVENHENRFELIRDHKNYLNIVFDIDTHGLMRVYLPIEHPTELEILDLIQLTLLEAIGKKEINEIFFTQSNSPIKKSSLDELKAFHLSQIPVKSHEFYHYSRSPYVK